MELRIINQSRRSLVCIHKNHVNALTSDSKIHKGTGNGDKLINWKTNRSNPSYIEHLVYKYIIY